MSYRPQGLGWTYTFDVPGLGLQTLVLPVEKLASDATSTAISKVEQRLPEIAPKIMPVLQKKVVAPLLSQAQAAMQPLIKSNLDYATKEAEKIGTKVAMIVALGFAGTLAASTWYLRREIRKGKS